MRYDKEYVVYCLKNYELMKNEYMVKILDLTKEIENLEVNTSLPGINYGEKVSTSGTSDPTARAVLFYEETADRLKRRLSDMLDKVESIERVVLIFEKLLSVMPVHYKVVDRMVFSDRETAYAMKTEMQRCVNTLRLMRENVYETIGVIARTEHSNDELIDMDTDVIIGMLDADLRTRIFRYEVGGDYECRV